MKTLEVIYCRSHTIGGFFIRNREDAAKRRWSHSGILFKNDSENQEDWEVYEARLFHRFGKVKFLDFIERYTEYKVVSYEVQNATAALDYLRFISGSKYATLTVIAMALGLQVEQQEKVHCQEAVELALQVAGCVPRWRHSAHIVTPNAGYSNMAGVVYKE